MSAPKRNLHITRWLAFIITMIMGIAAAEAEQASAVDSAQVTASILIAEPGAKVYSSLGHCTLRLQYPAANLDYVFTHEGENPDGQLMKTLLGRTKMMVVGVPTEEYLANCRDERRGVKQYVLNLPDSVKRLLWQQMDQRIMEPPTKWDYMNHSCALSLSRWIRAAVGDGNMQVSQWPEPFGGTRKEIGLSRVQNPWQRFLLSSFMSGEASRTDYSNYDKIILPVDLVDILSHTKAFGTPIITEAPTTLVEPQYQAPRPLITPVIACSLLLIVALANLWLRKSLIDWIVIIPSIALGCWVAFLSFISTLPCTQWNWLLLPFFPLIPALWRFRKRWGAIFAAIIAIWIVAMLIYPHRLIDPIYCIWAAALALTYLRQSLNVKQVN